MTTSERGASTLWIMLLTIASTLATLALACATPFTALAALAATQMRARDGLLLIGATWVASQAVGFCVLDYPRDPKTIAWGLAIGAGAVAAVLAGRWAAARAGGRGGIVRLAVAYVAATLAYKGVLALASLGLGGIGIALSPTYALQQFVRNGAFLVGLAALYRVLVAIGVPAAPRPEEPVPAATLAA